MIKAVANLFAGAIGILIILAIGTIVFGIFIVIGANTDQEAFSVGAALAIGGVVLLLSLGMACVLLDIMFNIRKISEGKNSSLSIGNVNTTRTEPEV